MGDEPGPSNSPTEIGEVLEVQETFGIPRMGEAYQALLDLRAIINTQQGDYSS